MNSPHTARLRLLALLLCAVLGLTGWAGLCRLLRGETLKLRELEYVQAAQAFGVSGARIMRRHIFPNVAHLMLIVTVLDFSALILYMLFIIGNLVKESKAGKYGAIWMFIGLGLGFVGFVAKGFIQRLLGIE